MSDALSGRDLAVVGAFTALVYLVGAGVVVFPLRTVVVATLLAVGTCGVLLAAVRWPTLADRVFGARVPLPGPLGVPVWMPVAALVCAVAAVAALAGRLSPVSTVFFLGLTLLALYLLVIVPLAVAQRRRRSTDPAGPLPSVSVLVPAYNEEGYVGRCLESLLAADYPSDLLEVVVVDDGSTDGTYEEAAAYRDEGMVVLTRENGGKHAALNDGLDRSTGDVVVTVDADSVVDADAIRSAVDVFRSDPDVGAVAGTVVVGNDDGFLTRLQALEYLVGIEVFRRAYSFFSAVPLVPGCLGAFRREALTAAGGFDPDTAAEDFDVTVAVQRLGWDARQTDAVVRTEAPFTLGDLFRQRVRWYTGSFQTLAKHRGVLDEPHTEFLHRFTYPVTLFSLLLRPFVGVVAVAAGLLAVAAGGAEAVLLGLGYVVLVFGLVVAIVVLETGSDLRLVAYSPLLFVGYRQFLDAALFVALWNLLTGRDAPWSSPSRKRQSERTTGSSPADD